jgi:hypothetical protein
MGLLPFSTNPKSPFQIGEAQFYKDCAADGIPLHHSALYPGY